jgi:AAA15 family ATPase/GTPase
MEIKNLEIKNFKSVKHLKLDCKRINLFIGEPNTGKSNIFWKRWDCHHT